MDLYADFGVNDTAVMQPVEPLLLVLLAVNYPYTVKYLLFTPVRIRRNTRAYKHTMKAGCVLF